MPQTWEAILAPFFQGVSGSLTGSWDDLPFQDDPLALDAWEDVFDTQAMRGLSDSEKIQARRLTTVDAPDVLDTGLPEDTGTAVAAREGPSPIDIPRMPRAATRGERTADFIAATKGVDVRKTKGAGKILDLAKTMIGVPYVFGAVNPGVAFDCSGFVKWLYSRALGVALPHSSTEQAKTLPKVGREDLQPGDLVFFSYGRLGEGVIDHVEVYMGDGKMIGTANTTDDLDIDNVDWSAFVQGGRPAGAGEVTTPDAAPAKALTDPVKGPKTKRVPIEHNQTLAPLSLASGAPAFASVIDALFAPDSMKIITEGATEKDPGGGVWKQLQQGFIDAGRPDLARAVATDDFKTWLRAENGALNPSLTSKYFPGHGVNYGLFQFWEGHDWTQQYVEGKQFTASPYQQAMLVAKHFGHLTPAKIREYAAQVRAGNYHGWG